MTNRRALTWSTAIRDVQADRVARAEVREERLRSIAGLGRPGGPRDTLTSWRGRSGRRYVVGIRATEAEVADLTEAVVIAVRRGRDGTANLLDAAVTSPIATRRARLRWLSRMRSRGATEMHVHLLAEDEAGRHAVVDDLLSSSS